MNDEQIDRVLEEPSNDMPAALAAKIRAQIQSETKPVKPLLSSPVYILIFAAIFLLAGILCAAIAKPLGWRVLSLQQATGFIAGLSVLAIAGGGMLQRSMRPGAGTLYSWLLSAAALAVYEALVLTLFKDHSIGAFVQQGMPCLELGLACAVAAALPIWLVIKTGFVVEPVQAGALVGLFGGLSGWFGLTLHCPLLTTPHAGVWHAAVVPICVAAGALVGRLLRGRSVA